MRGHVAGHWQTGGLGPPDEIERARGGEMRQVEPRARDIADDVGEERQVAGDRGLFRGGRPAAQPQHGRDVAIVRLGADGERRVLRVLHDRQPERTRVRERVAHHRCGGDRRAVVAEPDDPGVRQLAQCRERLAGSTRRDRAPGERAHRRPGLRRGGCHLRQHGRIVEGRRRVRHRADRREPAVSGRRQAAGHGLRVLVARLAEVRMEVDEARGNDHAVLVHAVGLARVEPRDRFQHTVRDDDLARALPTRRRVDEPGPRDLQVGDHGTDLRGCRRESAHALRTPASR
jgi:hypothetical protein